MANRREVNYKTRPGQAGESMAISIIEIIHLMYQNLTAIRFLVGLVETLQEELDRRIKQ